MPHRRQRISMVKTTGSEPECLGLKAANTPSSCWSRIVGLIKEPSSGNDMMVKWDNPYKGFIIVPKGQEAFNKY